MSQNMKSSKQFSKEVNRLGKIASIISLLAMFMVPIGTAMYFGVNIDIASVFAAASSLIAVFLPTAVVENLSFYPVLGAGGMYLGSITGNVTNMKIPVTVAGQKIAGVEPGTEEGDIIAMICVGVSSVVTIIVLFLGMFLLGSWLVPILNHPVLKPGFDQIIPALYGAITVPQVLKNKKLSVVPIVFGVIMVLLLGTGGFVEFQSYILISCLVVSVLGAYGMYRQGWIEE